MTRHIAHISRHRSRTLLAIMLVTLTAALFLSNTVIHPPLAYASTLSWSAQASMPTGRANLAAAASGGLIYAIGGESFDGGGNGLTTVEAYDPSANTWTARQPLAVKRYYHAAVATADGRIYVLGGRNDTGVLASVEMYNPATNTWTPRQPMPTARLGLGVTLGSDGKIYAIGGWDGDRLATVEVYDPATDSWSTRQPMPTARRYLAVATGSNSKIYAIGGSNADGFNFLLTVTDGERNGGGDVDRFRIKIWDTSTGAVIYDNQMGAADDANATTALGGGSIVIHDN
jgi:N-acetylneuraminic acid mutarotase